MQLSMASTKVPRIEVTFSPSSEDIDYLTEKINEESRALDITEEAFPFGIFIRRKDLPNIVTGQETIGKDDAKEEEIIAGCNGSVVYGAIYTDQLWVHPNLRGKGLGKFLMEKVEELGKSKNCNLATVGTMSFQGASTFYEKIGYICDFKRGGYTQGSSILSYKKDI